MLIAIKKITQKLKIRPWQSTSLRQTHAFESFYPVMSFILRYTGQPVESPNILSSVFSFSPQFSVAARLPASLFPRLSLHWKGPEGEGEGEEPVVNQNRRSSESPSHLFEFVRRPVYVEIVARAISPVTAQDQTA